MNESIEIKSRLEFAEHWSEICCVKYPEYYDYLMLKQNVFEQLSKQLNELTIFIIN